MLSFKYRFATWLVAKLIVLIYRTGRWSFHGQQHIEEALKAQRKVIICFWHGRLLMLPLCWKYQIPFYMLISQHRDGQLIAKVLTYFGINTVHGSSSKGGAKAAISLLRLLEQGAVMGITPDGPRGPHQIISDGTLQLARMADALVIPVAYDCKHKKHLSTWDHFLLPMPFSKGAMYAGKPMDARNYGKELEYFRQDLNQAMDETMAYATRLLDE